MLRNAVVGLSALTILGGCAAGQQARDVKESGFLGKDYALLRPGEEGEALLRYVDPDAPWRTYDKIKLDPVTIWTGEDSAFEDFSKPDRQKLADSFYTVLVEELAHDFEMVDELGPGVLHLQVAITDAQASNPTMDTISSIVPQALLLSQAKGLVTGKPGFVGEASAEFRGRTAKRASWWALRSTGGSAASPSPARRRTRGTTCIRPIAIGPSSSGIVSVRSGALPTARHPRRERA